MALNFLKRKITSRKSVLLYHNPYIKRERGNDFAAHVEDSLKSVIKDFPDRPVSNISRKDLQQEKSACKKLKAKKVIYEPLDEVGSLPAERNVSEQKWSRAKERIEKLLFEISDLLNSDDDSQSSDTIIELNSDKANDPKSQESSDQPYRDNSCVEPDAFQTNEVSKLPLDIEELHTIAAMAKRLSARSKI